MIYELYIKNCALIEELRVEFGNKLNILTGETGSGKSIILDALNLCLGGKFDRTYIRNGETYGEVETVVFSENPKFISYLNNLNIPIEDDKMAIINRKLYLDGKTVTKVNGKNIKVSDLKNLMSTIVDIHGQHQNQALYTKENHIDFLDLYGKDDIFNVYNKYRVVFEEYNEIKKQILRLNENKTDREVQRELDLLKFQMNEIENSNLNEEEYLDLKKRREIYENGEKIYNSLKDAYNYLHDSQFNAEDQIGNASNVLSSISKFDKELEQIEENTNNIMYELQDISNTIRNYLDNIDFKPYMLDEIQERLDVINTMKRKYGDSIPEILDYYDKICKRVDDIENREERHKNLQQKLEEKKIQLSNCADELSKKRHEVAISLEKNLLDELYTLNMKNTKFKVNFKKVDFNEKGNDDVEFLVSFNLGEDMNPLYKVASGGEMSRFMLGFKSILADVDKIESLIFDEIDTGISGRAAQTVGEKLSDISKRKQIICITHLPQIASFADDHYYIEKNVEKERTYTSIIKLDREYKKNEIARLISGSRITEKTVQHADEILEIADQTKLNP